MKWLFLGVCTLAILGGCSSGSGTHAGGILQLTVEDIERVEDVAFTGELEIDGLGKDYVIRPSREENELVVVRVTLFNQEARLAELDVKGLPAELRMDSGRYRSLNVDEERMGTEEFHVQLNKYIPLIRDFHYLNRGDELEGWLIFDVPKGSEAESLKWVAGGDIVIIDL